MNPTFKDNTERSSSLPRELARAVGCEQGAGSEWEEKMDGPAENGLIFSTKTPPISGGKCCPQNPGPAQVWENVEQRGGSHKTARAPLLLASEWGRGGGSGPRGGGRWGAALSTWPCPHPPAGVGGPRILDCFKFCFYKEHEIYRLLRGRK